jgi:hypothetical protein
LNAATGLAIAAMAIWKIEMISLDLNWLNTFVSTVVHMEGQDTSHDWGAQIAQ